MSMKRVVISWIILFSIIIYGAAGIFFIYSNNTKIIPILDNIQTTFTAGNAEEALEITQKLEQEWRSYKKHMGILIRDERLQYIDNSIARIEPYIKADNAEELTAEIQVVRRYIDNLFHSELPFWFNIL